MNDLSRARRRSGAIAVVLRLNRYGVLSVIDEAGRPVKDQRLGIEGRPLGQGGGELVGDRGYVEIAVDQSAVWGTVGWREGWIVGIECLHAEFDRLALRTLEQIQVLEYGGGIHVEHRDGG